MVSRSMWWCEQERKYLIAISCHLITAYKFTTSDGETYAYIAMLAEYGE